VVVINFDDYKHKVMLHLLQERGHADTTQVLDFIEQEYGGYPDGFGGLLFDTPQQETWFVLRWT
jgi:hypothetical protein